MPKSMGEDAEMDARMERCVKRVMQDGHGKVAAIKICKASMMGPHGETPRKGSRG
jgi:hypothetical protein